MTLKPRDISSLIWNTMPRKLRVGKKDPKDMTEKEYEAYCRKMAKAATLLGEPIFLMGAM